MNYSNTLKKMIIDKKGYRTESFSGSNCKKIMNIAEFEIFELQNIDILDFIYINYLTLLSENEQYLIAEILNFDENEDLEEFLFEFKDEIKNIVRNICYKLLQTKNIYGVWLTTKENVKSIYDGKDEDMDEYFIGNYIPISDLDNDGVLFIYK